MLLSLTVTRVQDLAGGGKGRSAGRKAVAIDPPLACRPPCAKLEAGRCRDTCEVGVQQVEDGEPHHGSGEWLPFAHQPRRLGFLPGAVASVDEENRRDGPQPETAEQHERAQLAVREQMRRAPGGQPGQLGMLDDTPEAANRRSAMNMSTFDAALPQAGGE